MALKSIALSNIVNALLIAKSKAYPHSPEVQTGRVFKLRDAKYIKSGSEYSYVQVDFVNSSSVKELILHRQKKHFESCPNWLSLEGAITLFNRLKPEASNGIDVNIDQSKAATLMQNNCVLYFPPNRFEDPAWQNTENLLFKPKYSDEQRLTGYTNRKIIMTSILQQNQNWLFDLILDSQFEGISGANTSTNKSRTKLLLSNAINLLDKILVFPGKATLSIGSRLNRGIFITSKTSINLFQLSSGEVSLLNIFLSILRDYDYSQDSVYDNREISGIVVIDEIDLHLHAKHQFETLPILIAMFPMIQFLITSHSPLFLLGLEKTLGSTGLEVYELPRGESIKPEEFGEFATAYQAFSATTRHRKKLQSLVDRTTKPLVFVEGKTDKIYLDAAVQKLGMVDFHERIEIHIIGSGGGKGNLKQAWNGLQRMKQLHSSLVLLFDFDANMPCKNFPDDEQPWLYQRTITKIEQNPVKIGVENLFSKETLQKALAYKKAFIDVEMGHERIVRGNSISIEEKWIVNEDEKTNLCNWLCDHGSVEDFEDFRPTLCMLKSILLTDNV